MGESRDVMNLELVQSDIEQTLQQAQQELEACLSGDGNSQEHLQSCYEAVRQVRGSLHMVGLSGAVMLAEQMESLLGGMRDGDVSDLDGAYAAMAQALVYLPPYLSRVKSDGEESPLLLLSAINELRGAQGVSLLPELQLFEPKLGNQRPAANTQIKNAFNENSDQSTKKVRQIYQFALVGLIRNEDIKVNLARISNVLARLQQECKGTRISQLWEISSALMEGLIGESIELNSHAIDLLRSIDKEIKELASSGADGLDRQSSPDLLKGLLYYIAKTPAATPHVRAVKQEYRLDQYPLVSNHSQESVLIAPPDKETLNSVVVALTEELQRIKDTIDLYVRNEAKGDIDLGGLRPSLCQISSTLELLNMEAPKLVVQEQLEVLVKHSNGGIEIANEQLLEIAEALLYVEAELDSIAERISSVGEQDSLSVHTHMASEAVITESLSNLKKAKDALSEFMGSDGDYDLIADVPQTLRGAYGGLTILELNTPAQLIFSIAQYVEDDISARQQTPEQPVMDMLAEVAAAVEYYLEGLVAKQPVNGSILEGAKASMAALGYPIEQTEGIVSDQNWQLHDSEEDGIIEPQELVAEEQVSQQQSEVEVLLETESTEAPETDDQEGTVAASDRQSTEQNVEEVEAKVDIPADDSMVDEEIIEIFVEEAEEVLATIDEYWPKFAEGFSDVEALKEVRRSFHTLKGSGRMVEASVIAELAWSVENMLNNLIEGGVSASSAMVTLVDQVRSELPALVRHFKEQTQPELDVSALMSCADKLAAGELLTEVADETTAPPQTEEKSEDALYEIFAKESAIHIGVLEAFIEDTKAAAEPVHFTDQLHRALHTLKGSAHMASLPAIANVASAGESLVREMRDFEIPADSEMVAFLGKASELLHKGVAQLQTGSFVEIDGSETLLEEVAQLLTSRIPEQGESAQGQLSPVVIFMRQNVDALCVINDEYEEWQKDSRLDSEHLLNLMDGLASVNTSVEAQEIPELQTLLATMQYVYRTVVGLKLPVPSRLLASLSQAHEGLVTLVDQLAAGQDLVSADDWVAALDNELNQVQELQQATGEKQSVEQAEAEEPVAEEQIEQKILAEVDALETLVLESEDDRELLEIFLSEAEEIMDIVAEAKQRWIEAPDQLAAVDELQRGLHTLKGSSRMTGVTGIGNLSHELESIYENINAGRLKVSDELFELVHECDDRLVDMLTSLKADLSYRSANDLINKVRQFHQHQLQGKVAPIQPVSEPSVDDMNAADQMANFIEKGGKLLKQLASDIKKAAKKRTKPEKAHQTICSTVSALQSMAYEQAVHEVGDLCQIYLEVINNIAPQELITKEAQTDLTEWLERIESSYKEAQSITERDELEKSVAPQAVTDPSERQSGKENVRVSSDLLERLVDLAGETSVSRSRVEQQVSNFGYAIDEIGSTVERLREQLRRMEIETEAQILFRQEREGPAHKGFDPLEMDRYSRMQELSRALVESVSDLFDLKETLQDRSRYTESLLLQQSRVNTELQEGLMKTRMVPFARMVPRLRRIARQVGNELGKQVNLSLKNVELELDRSLLEHMTAPLEHMIRNALDHGVESPSQREASGKDRVGNIELELNRDGGDIVLTLRDDGAGIDVNSIRKKAIEQGLMTAEAELSDHQVMQFIMQAGFSTAKQVTQISGRGVGMDVVRSEIKQLGGSIDIASRQDEGSCFTVRVPFTVSINRALMVNVADEVYALPLSTVEGVVRVSPYELEEYYKADGPEFEYAGQKYELHYLGQYTGHGNSYLLQNQALPLPVVLIRTADRAIAIQVDSISGSREIVVKPLGPQLGAIPGMSGATILGDGRVVLILDIAAMARSMEVMPDRALIHADAKLVASDNLQVMVVDDSVTVRKVASRLLERNGMDVIVAKDGVEAMTKLQDVIPDIMLLDIEMPRMDGFELASFMRNDDDLKEVPIVMITSRTGDKHRDRALEIGVNRFMGKPFQEGDLLDAIAELTNYERHSELPDAAASQ